MDTSFTRNGRGFPAMAGIFLGLGLGGFFDGIIFHQVLQWHHMFTSAGYPANNLGNLKFNVMWDGVFHISTYIFTATGMAILWSRALKLHDPWSGKLLVGAMLMGFGIFNLVEGIVDHEIFGIHHVNETVPPSQWIYWDMGFLIWGAAMLVTGWFLWRTGERDTSTGARRLDRNY